MLKLFLFSILFCFIGFIHSDQLSDAIHSSDLQQTTSLLSSKINDKQLDKYIDIAKQVIKTRKEQMRAHRGGDFHYSKNTKLFLCAAPTLFLSVLPLIPAIDYYEKRNLYNKALPYTVGVLSGFASSMVSFIACIFSSKNDIAQYRQNQVALYNNAVRIKELLYDYEIDLSNTSNL